MECRRQRQLVALPFVVLMALLQAGCASDTAHSMKAPPSIDEPAPTPPPDH